jgi:hypothetical protein
MSNVHIFRAPGQKATRFKTEFGVIKSAPRALRWCFNCDKRRWAKHLTVQVYYDGVYYFCSPGHGCKTPKDSSSG